MASPKVRIDGKIVSISNHACERFAERTQLSLSDFYSMMDGNKYRKIGAPPTYKVISKPKKHDLIKRSMEIEIATSDAYVIYSVPDAEWFIFYINGASIMATVMPLDWVKDRPVLPSIKEATLREAVYGHMAPLVPRREEVRDRTRLGLYRLQQHESVWEQVCLALMT